MQQQTFSVPPWGAPGAERKAAPSGMELMNRLSQVFSAALMEGLNQLQASMPAPSADVRRDECVPEPCQCECCIGDADLVVYARLGERRIVPLIIENRRRRERQIRLELSGWTTRRGTPSGITGRILEPTEFTLPPCERHEIVLIIDTLRAEKLDAIKTERVDATKAESPDRRRLPDVDECQVFYADLRVEGCDIRPIRIALALLPRDCDAYQVECRCTCC